MLSANYKVNQMGVFQNQMPLRSRMTSCHYDTYTPTAVCRYCYYGRMDLLLRQIKLYFGEHPTKSQINSGGDFQSWLCALQWLSVDRTNG
jgi:hypothetical protein